MFYLYVLRSVHNGKRYIGSTRSLPEVRLKQHNSGGSTWTRFNRPFELIYVESYLTYQEARKRESFLKTGVGREQLTSILERNFT